MDHTNQVADANINRITEGLRVIEEYVRFVRCDEPLTQTLSGLRKSVSRHHPGWADQLAIRNIDHDMRAKEPPAPRKDWLGVLRANFKRAEEALRVMEEITGDPAYTGWRYDVYQLEKDIVLPLIKKPISKGVYVISDRPEVLVDAANKGAALVQLRDKHASKAELYKRAVETRSKLSGLSVPFIVNDFLDIAIDVGADGFHSGQDDVPISVIRTQFGPHKIIGRTTHNLEQGLMAEKEGADYVSVGPIWETPSKPGRDGIGFEYLRQAAKSLEIPFVAIGGVNAENFSDVWACNPPLIGVIRAYDEILKLVKSKLISV